MVKDNHDSDRAHQLVGQRLSGASLIHANEELLGGAFVAKNQRLCESYGGDSCVELYDRLGWWARVTVGDIRC